MAHLSKLFVWVILLLGLGLLFYYTVLIGLLVLVLIIFFELVLQAWVNALRLKFQWLITKKDLYPVLSEEGLKKFMSHGYDSEVGWVRKPNTSKEELGKYGKTSYSIDSTGSRSNPGHEKYDHKITLYGDSFTFARQVNDTETFGWHLSELSKVGVHNFGVGNYGVDQALMRFKREKDDPSIVIMGVVPSTIVRILCVWKHYNEFGNTFGFKPRYRLEGGSLVTVENIINTDEKFLNYRKYLKEIQDNDYFYKNKFLKEMITVPYLVSVLANPSRNIRLLWLVSYYSWIKKENEEQVYPVPMKVIMKINRDLRVKLFKTKEAVDLFLAILKEYKSYALSRNIKPVFLFMPQKDDLTYIKSNGAYYSEVISEVSEMMTTIDLTPHLLNRTDLDTLYSDDNEYGGHFSKEGNELIGTIIYDELKGKEIL